MLHSAVIAVIVVKMASVDPNDMVEVTATLRRRCWSMTKWSRWSSALPGAWIPDHQDVSGRQERWPGVRQVPEGSGEQGKMEETRCEISCGAPSTLAVKK